VPSVLIADSGRDLVVCICLYNMCIHVHVYLFIYIYIYIYIDVAFADSGSDMVAGDAQRSPLCTEAER